jgi:hypothetical protein
MPVFVRAGGVVPTQPAVPTTAIASPAALVLTAYAGSGGTTVYDDAGDGLDHLKGRYARTTIRQRRRHATTTLSIGPSRGSYAGKPARRSWEVRLVGVRKPKRVMVAGRTTKRWTYVPKTRTITVKTGSRSTRSALEITVR